MREQTVHVILPKFMTYTAMEYTTGYILGYQVVDKRETALVSNRMELYGMMRCMGKIFEGGLSVDRVCTEQYTSVWE